MRRFMGWLRSLGAAPGVFRDPLWIDMEGEDHLLACREHRHLLVRAARVLHPKEVRASIGGCQVGPHAE